MISYRKADLLDKLRATGEAEIVFTLGYDEFKDGSREYFVASDSGGGFDWGNSNDLFKAEVEYIMEKALGFHQTSYGAWKRGFGDESVTTRYLEGFFAEGGILGRFKERGFYAASIIDVSSGDEFQVTVVISKNNLSKKADLYNKIKDMGVKTLIFEKGYLVHNGRGSNTYTYDCANGRTIGADLVPPIKVTQDLEDHILSTEMTKFLQQLWAWGFEVVETIYDDEKQRVMYKVRKKP